jgi:membrane-anchored mycosin MYCP
VASAAALLGCTLPVLTASPATAVPDQNCVFPAGSTLTSVPWAQQRLSLALAQTLTKGAGVRVAVIDSGIDRSQAQVAQIRIADSVNLSNSGSGATDIYDCTSKAHGTGVASIIAAPQVSGSAFVGVAPAATIIPIRQTASDSIAGTVPAIIEGIDYAIAKKARVINLSSVIPASPELLAVVKRAAADNVIIVAAAGNDGQNTGTVTTPYPAAYASQFPNVIAVGAIDEKGAVASYSDTGAYMSVVAPGSGLIQPAHHSGYMQATGTSFAAPFVTGTVALMLAAHPSMTPLQVRNRLEATADPPAATVPSPKYGHGVINPYRAITSLRDDLITPPPAAKPAAVPPLAARRAPDRHLDHLAVAAGLGLIGLAAIAAVAAAAFRRPAVTTATTEIDRGAV